MSRSSLVLPPTKLPLSPRPGSNLPKTTTKLRFHAPPSCQTKVASELTATIFVATFYTVKLQLCRRIQLHYPEPSNNMPRPASNQTPLLEAQRMADEVVDITKDNLNKVSLQRSLTCSACALRNWRIFGVVSRHRHEHSQHRFSLV